MGGPLGSPFLISLEGDIMVNTLIKEETFTSRWLGKKGSVRVEARRNDPKGLIIVVKFDDEQYDETLWDLPWNIAKMVYNHATVAADALILQCRCFVADRHVWLISGSLAGIMTVSCKTGEHFCEGKQFVISQNRSDTDIKNIIAKTIEEEVPF